MGKPECGGQRWTSEGAIRASRSTVFFFSSRRRHTRFDCDWSSDVCSSDLRALPDAELDGFVDVLARRIASFDRRPIAAAKNLINQVSLPSADRLLDAFNSFQTALTWPEAQQRIEALLKRGLQRDADFERHWPALLETQSP